MKTVWRVYCYDGNQGREFGQDYTRSEAIRIARQYRNLHKQFRYRVRKVALKGKLKIYPMYSGGQDKTR
jgi:hypothetical protein